MQQIRDNFTQKSEKLAKKGTQICKMTVYRKGKHQIEYSRKEMRNHSVKDKHNMTWSKRKKIINNTDYNFNIF